MNTRTALVVDDSKSARFALRKYLENQGFSVDAVDGAAEAYNFLQKQRPRVIFMDHMMPEIDGFQALHHIKEDLLTADIPVVICSSNDAPEFQREARDRGAIDVLQKPPQTEHLIRILDNLQKLPTEPALGVEAFDLAIESPLASIPPPAQAPSAPAVTASALKAAVSTPSKVSNIREPEIAIEQAVMKALRGAMQPRVEAAPPQLAAPVSAPHVEFNPTATGSFSLSQTRSVDAAQLTALREQVESRMKKLTQDFFMQIAELKGTVSHMESRGSGASPEAMQQIAESASAGLYERLEALEASIHGRLSELSDKVEAKLREQENRIAQITEAARSAAAEEAQSVAERTMMAVATSVAEKLAEPLLKAREADSRKLAGD